MGMMSHLVLAFWLVAAPADPAATEREAKAIEGLLIAPCCWSQQVSVHHSPAADEIRQNVRRWLAEGQTRQQILDRYVAEYGDRILAEPPARGFSRLFHVGPWVFLVLSVGVVVLVIRRFRGQAAPAAAAAPVALDPDDADRVDDALRDLDEA